MYGVIAVELRKTICGPFAEVFASKMNQRDMCSAQKISERNAGRFHIVVVVHECERCKHLSIPDTSYDAEACDVCGELYRVT